MPKYPKYLISILISFFNTITFRLMRLGIPCFTLRTNTERPITVEIGTNTLVGQGMRLLTSRFNAVLDGDNSWDCRPREEFRYGKDTR